MSRERVEEALRLVEESGVSVREAARRLGVSRDSLAKYFADPLYRRVQGRCGRCGHVVRLPCGACSLELHAVVVQRQQRLRSAARRTAPSDQGAAG
ncbi:MAG: helix-turn-helix domain-containing protein [Lacipirellulaceae bacterium]